MYINVHGGTSVHQHYILWCDTIYNFLADVIVLIFTLYTVVLSRFHLPLLTTCGHTLGGESSQLHSAYSYTVLEIK